MIPLRQAWAETLDTLTAAQVASPLAETRALVSFVTGAEPSRLALVDALDPAQAAALAQAVADRASGRPLQHITGQAFFRTVTVRVGPGVFIPRPETELLAGWAIAQVVPTVSQVVELCAGSGAISLSIATEATPGAQWAVEVSRQAYDYLAANLSGSAVQPVLADMADALSHVDGTVDLVVANPPYVPTAAQLPVEVRHDPAQALFAGPDGLSACAVVARVAGRLLRPGGVVGCEHGEDQAVAVGRLFSGSGLSDVASHPDLTGRPRFTTARKPI